MRVGHQGLCTLALHLSLDREIDMSEPTKDMMMLSFKIQFYRDHPPFLFED